MASGSFNLTKTGATSSYITFTCRWLSTSNGSSANSSNVNVQVIASKSSASTSNTWGTHNTSASVNSSPKSNSGSFTLTPGGSITLLNKTYVVPHDSDGKKSTTISVSVGGDVMWANGSANITLDTIPRESSISVANYNLGQNLSIVVGKKSNSFTSTLTYKIGTRTGTIITKTSDSTYVWEMSSELIEQIKIDNPNTKNVTATIFCETYSGNDKIGSTTQATFTLSIVDKPIVDSVSISETVSKIINYTTKIVKYLSIPRFEVNTTVDTGSSIASYKVKCGDKEKTSSTNNFTMSDIQHSYLNDNNERKTKFIINVTDTRGNISNDYELECDFIEYVNLAFNNTDIKLVRESTISNTINLHITGYIYNGLIGETKNTLILQYRYKLKNNNQATWSELKSITVTLNDDNTFSVDDYQFEDEFNYQENYDVEFYIQDLFNKVKYETVIKTSDTIAKWHKEGLDVKGLTIQKQEVVSVSKSGSLRRYSDGFCECFKVVSVGTVPANNSIKIATTAVPNLKDNIYNSIQASINEAGTGWENLRILINRAITSAGSYQLNIKVLNTSSSDIENVKISYFICGYEKDE